MVNVIIISDFKRKIQTWTGIQNLDFQISSLALYHLSYPGLIDSKGLILSLKSNAMQGILVCVTIYHQLTGKLTMPLFPYSHVFKIKLICGKKPIMCALWNYNCSLQEKNWIRIWTSDFQISSLVLYHLRYSGSIDNMLCIALLSRERFRSVLSIELR